MPMPEPQDEVIAIFFCHTGFFPLLEILQVECNTILHFLYILFISCFRLPIIATCDNLGRISAYYTTWNHFIWFSK